MRQFEMKAEIRDNAGSRQSRRLRRDGRLPGVLCGHGVESRALHVSVKDFVESRKQHARIIMLQLAGATEPAIVHEIDWDNITEEPLHVDFQRVNMSEKVEVEVEVKAKGPAKGEADGGILVLQMHQVRVRCLPLDIPDFVEVDIRSLNVHDSIHVKNLVLPKNIEAVDAAEQLVLSIVEPKKEEVPVAGAAEAAAAEPEVIAKAAKTDEEAAAGGEAPAGKEKEKKADKK